MPLSTCQFAPWSLLHRGGWIGIAVFLLTGCVLLFQPHPWLFRIVVAADPLFAAGELDRPALDAAMQTLRADERALRDETNRRAFPLYPYALWEALAHVSRAHALFLDAQNEQTRAALIEAWKATHDAYALRVAERERAFARIITSEGETVRDRPLSFPGGRFATTLETLRHDNALAGKNAAALSREITFRSCALSRAVSCLDEKLIIAGRLALRNLKHMLLPDAAPVASDISTLPFEMLFPHARQIIGVRGPYLAETFCFGDKTGRPSREVMVIADAVDHDGADIRLATLATDALYLRPGPTFAARTSAREMSPYFQYLSEHGWSGSPQPSAAVYVCPQFSHALAAFSFAAGGNGADLAGLPDALRFISARGLRFQLRYEQAISQEHSARSAFTDLFLFSSKSPFDLNFFPHAHAIWRIRARPQYFNPAAEIESPPIMLTRFSELAERHGLEEAHALVATFRTQGEWLLEFAASRLETE